MYQNRDLVGGDGECWLLWGGRLGLLGCRLFGFCNFWAPELCTQLEGDADGHLCQTGGRYGQRDKNFQDRHICSELLAGWGNREWYVGNKGGGPFVNLQNIPIFFYIKL